VPNPDYDKQLRKAGKFVKTDTVHDVKERRQKAQKEHGYTIHESADYTTEMIQSLERAKLINNNTKVNAVLNLLIIILKLTL